MPASAARGHPGCGCAAVPGCIALAPGPPAAGLLRRGAGSPARRARVLWPAGQNGRRLARDQRAGVPGRAAVQARRLARRSLGRSGHSGFQRPRAPGRIGPHPRKPTGSDARRPVRRSHRRTLSRPRRSVSPGRGADVLRARAMAGHPPGNAPRGAPPPPARGHPALVRHPGPPADPIGEPGPAGTVLHLAFRHPLVPARPGHPGAHVPPPAACRGNFSPPVRV